MGEAGACFASGGAAGPSDVESGAHESQKGDILQEYRHPA